MKVAIYIRVSTVEQAEEGFSISAQRERLAAYCMSQGWEIIDFYVDDGVSAKDTNRKELQRMLSDIETGNIDVVLVYKLDRLTRSVLDLYQLLEVFEKYNVKFKSATEVYDTTTAIGRLFLTLVAALAQWYRENLSENVRFGMAEKVRQGQWHGSEASFGYDYIVDTKQLIVNEVEAPIVVKMYNLYLQGYSDRKIAMYLNEQGIKTKKGAIWRENSVRYILTNPIYIGTLRWGVRVNVDDAFEVNNVVPPIIGVDVFDKAQAIRESRRKFHGRQATSDFIFSGVLRCVRCGGPFKGHTKRDKGVRYKSYRCINRLIGNCDMPMISEKIVEHQFINHLKRMNFDVKIEHKEKDETTETEQEIKELNNAISKIEGRKKRWQYAWVNEMLSDDEFRERMAEENKKEEEVKFKLNALVDIESPKLTDGHIQSIVSHTLKEWNELDDLEKKQIVTILLDKILIEILDISKRTDRAKILEITLN